MSKTGNHDFASAQDNGGGQASHAPDPDGTGRSARASGRQADVGTRQERTADEDGAISRLSFEEALGQLEEIVGGLENGETSLERSISLYEKGEKLRAHCEEKLKLAEARVHQIRLNSEGKPDGTEPFVA